MEQFRDAVKYCARFTDNTYLKEPERLVNCVQVTSHQVVGTDGPSCLIVPIEPLEIVAPLYLTDVEAAMVEYGDSSPSVELLPQLGPRPHGGYPDIEEMTTKIRQSEPCFSLLVNPKYLARVGQAFQEMGVNGVRMVFRGEREAIEIIGQREEETSPIIAFVMPRKPKP